MKRFFMYTAIGAIFLNMNTIQSFGQKTIFGIRSQGLDGVRELTGWQQLIYKYDQDRNYGTVAAVVEYNRSFRPDQISDFLFGADSLRFSGSTAVRQTGDILADYFGLPSDFSSTMSFSPHISNVIVDLNWFQAFDGYVPGLFVMLHAPIVHTKWNLYAHEECITSGTAFYPAGYMSDKRIDAVNLSQTMTQALQGKSIFGDMDQQLQYGKISDRQTRSRIAEMQGTLGWNYNQSWYHVGVSFRVGAPTGNTTTAEFLFEDIVGNRHHWDIGFGLSGHVVCWDNKESGRKIALYGTTQLSHLCKSKQKRSFDFAHNGPGSRYILLQELQQPSKDLLINNNAPVHQYMGNLVNAINYTTLNAQISIPVQTDIVLKISYRRDGFECDLGYNFWANSKEKLHCRDMFPENRFALKGDAQIYGFTLTETQLPIAVNATQSNATVLSGQNNGNVNYQNTNADNLPAVTRAISSNSPLIQLNQQDSQALKIPELRIFGSNPASVLTDADINTDSGLLPRALSNTFFAYVGCVWDNRDDIDPYLGLGVSAELANTNVCNNATCSQWAIWVKGGLAY